MPRFPGISPGQQVAFDEIAARRRANRSAKRERRQDLWISLGHAIGQAALGAGLQIQGQGFEAGEAAKARDFETSERLGGQDFSGQQDALRAKSSVEAAAAARAGEQQDMIARELFRTRLEAIDRDSPNPYARELEEAEARRALGGAGPVGPVSAGSPAPGGDYGAIRRRFDAAGMLGDLTGETTDADFAATIQSLNLPPEELAAVMARANPGMSGRLPGAATPAGPGAPGMVDRLQGFYGETFSQPSIERAAANLPGNVAGGFERIRSDPGGFGRMLLGGARRIGDRLGFGSSGPGGGAVPGGAGVYGMETPDFRPATRPVPAGGRDIPEPYYKGGGLIFPTGPATLPPAMGPGSPLPPPSFSPDSSPSRRSLIERAAEARAAPPTATMQAPTGPAGPAGPGTSAPPLSLLDTAVQNRLSAPSVIGAISPSPAETGYPAQTKAALAELRRENLAEELGGKDRVRVPGIPGATAQQKEAALSAKIRKQEAEYRKKKRRGAHVGKVGSTLGTLVGSSLGGALGSLVPGVGTTAGIYAGGLAGGYLGGYGGRKVGERL